eukprot:6763658-Pyramimonas_sp.AAC.1
MQVPEDLCEFFSLPPVRAGLAGASQLNGVAIHESDRLLLSSRSSSWAGPGRCACAGAFRRPRSPGR